MKLQGMTSVLAASVTKYNQEDGSTHSLTATLGFLSAREASAALSAIADMQPEPASSVEGDAPTVKPANIPAKPLAPKAVEKPEAPAPAPKPAPAPAAAPKPSPTVAAQAATTKAAAAVAASIPAPKPAAPKPVAATPAKPAPATPKPAPKPAPVQTEIPGSNGAGDGSELTDFQRSAVEALQGAEGLKPVMQFFLQAYGGEGDAFDPDAVTAATDQIVADAQAIRPYVGAVDRIPADQLTDRIQRSVTALIVQLSSPAAG